MASHDLQGQLNIEVANIGGIDHMKTEIGPGVTVLAGRNATNRTSFLRAIMAALGSHSTSIKADADEAHVSLTIDDETYSRYLERSNGGIRFDGEPYLDDPLLADLFAFLLETNDARRAVTTDADLRDLIMQPIDTDEIQSEIDQLVERRRALTNELEEIESLKAELPGLEEERSRLESEIETTKQDLAETETALEEHDGGVEQTREAKDDLEETLSELQRKRSELESVRYELETERDSLDALRAEQRELEAEADDLPETPMGDHDEIDTRIDHLRNRKQRLESELNDLQSVVQFNEEMLEGTGDELVDALEDDDGEGDGVTAELLPDQSVTCWTCGSDVEPAQIENTITTLRTHKEETVQTVTDIDSELDELKERREERRREQRQFDRIERRRAELEDEIAETEERIETLSGRRDEYRDEIAELEAAIETQEDGMQEAVLELHREANQYEYDLGKLENELDQVDSKIKSIESRLGEESAIESKREDVKAEIEQLRTKIEQIERNAVEEFNEHMERVLERLDYQNIDRIWLEKSKTEIRDGREKIEKSVFELHIVRQTENGAAYRDSVDHLSESEREVVGLIFALAGYLVHEVYDTVPFLLLDSLEAIDSERIATLIEYLETYSPYLVVALLEEDAAALGDAYEYISLG